MARKKRIRVRDLAEIVNRFSVHALPGGYGSTRYVLQGCVGTATIQATDNSGSAFQVKLLELDMEGVRFASEAAVAVGQQLTITIDTPEIAKQILACQVVSIDPRELNGCGGRAEFVDDA